MTNRSFVPTVRKIPIPQGGRIDSRRLSEFVNQTVIDIHLAGQAITEQTAKLEENLTVKTSELNDIRQRLEHLSSLIEAMRTDDAINNRELVYRISMYDSRNFFFLSDSSFANRVLVDTVLGEATVPVNGIEPRFYHETVNSRTIIPIEDLNITVTGTFDAGDGQGVVNHEQGGTVVAGEPLHAFNGNNNTRWLRKVWFPLYSDVTEIMTEITVDIPEGSGGESNSVYVIPSPAGELDVVATYTSPDLSDSFILVDNFEEVSGVAAKRWLFPTRPVHRVKIRFRQRNWVEENGRKVFYIGAQEIGLQLIEWDKTYSSASPDNENHSVVLKQDAPNGYLFNTLTSLSTDPLHTLEDLGSRHIHVKVSTEADGSNVIWNSDLDALPQNLANGYNITPVATLYFIVTLNWVATSGGAQSPFPVGTSPVFKGLSFNAMVESV